MSETNETEPDQPRRPPMVMPSITRDPDTGQHRPVVLPDEDEGQREGGSSV